MTESAQKQPQSAAYDVTSADHVGTFVEYDGLVVNISNYTVTFEGHNLEMPPKELEILYFLASRQGAASGQAVGIRVCGRHEDRGCTYQETS